jgi:hypothetical protein
MKNIIYLICIFLSLTAYSYAGTELVPTASAALISSINITESPELTQLTQAQMAAGTAISREIMEIEIDNNHVDGFTVWITDDDGASGYLLEDAVVGGSAVTATDDIPFVLSCGYTDSQSNPPIFETPANATDNDNSGSDSNTVNALYDMYTFGYQLAGTNASEDAVNTCLNIDDPKIATIGSILDVRLEMTATNTKKFVQNTAGTVKYTTTLTVTITDN